jgi:hypothetical protein
MKRIQLIISILVGLLLSGCATTYQYEGNKFPPLSSSSFPSFDSLSEITAGIKFKLAEGNGKAKMVTNVTRLMGQRNIPLISTNVDWRWDRKLNNNLIYSNHDIDIIMNDSNERKTVNLTLRTDSIHETSGKETKMNISSVSIDGKEKIHEMTIEQVNKAKSGFSDVINYDLACWGKTVKTGDVLRYTKNEFSNMKTISGQNIQGDIPEVVKGMGIHRNKTVIVTEIRLEDSIRTPESIIEIRGKGYSLYDAETFVQLYQEAVIYMNVFTPREGTFNLKTDLRIEAYDVMVSNAIDLPDPTNIHTVKESPTPPWSEASEKIKTLGELFQKGLISKEEYETKKKELLNNF